MIVLASEDAPFGGWWTRYKKRRKRRWRAYKARRRERLRRVRRRWRHFWQNWWHLIATIVHRIGTLIITWFVPVLGKYVGQIGQKYLNAARNAQLRIKQGKALGHAAIETFRTYVDEAPDGAIGVLQRISGKYGSDFVVPQELQAPMQAILNHPSVKKIVELDGKLDDLPDGSAIAAAIEKQIDELEEGADGVLDDLVDLEQALDAAYWKQFPPLHQVHPKGSPKYQKYDSLDAAKWSKHIDVVVDRIGDMWVRWKQSDVGNEPEGTELGVWYRVTGDPIFLRIASSTPEFQEAAAATDAARAAVLQETQNEQVYLGQLAPGSVAPAAPRKKKIPGWGWALIAGGTVMLLGGMIYTLRRKD